MAKISFLLVSIGVLINAIIIPPYQGVSPMGDIKDEKLWKFRKYGGYFANTLIFLGVIGQIIVLFSPNLL